MYEELKGKKLLVIGSGEEDSNIVRTAKSLGVYVIVADGTAKSPRTFAKNIADESWDINYSNIEEIAEKCKQAHVDGVVAGYSEFRVLAACKIANRIGTPFYATEEQIELTRNKRLFKDKCSEYGVPVPRDYVLTSQIPENIFDSVTYPVIVKPTDYAGRKGITICNERTQLEEAIPYALKLSQSKTVIVEDYIVGTEFCAIYSISDGEISLSCFNEKYLNEEQVRKTGLCDLAKTPSKYLSRYIDTTDKGVRAFLQGIGAKNGVAFFQGIVDDRNCWVFEMGYRLNGGNDYFLVEQNNNISYMKMLISHSLTGKMGDDLKKDNPFFKTYHCNYIIYAHEGTVAKAAFTGDVAYPGIDEIHACATPGMTIVEDGSTQQRVFSFKISADSVDGIADLIRHIQAHTLVEDAFGNSLLFSPFDIRRLNSSEENK